MKKTSLNELVFDPVATAKVINGVFCIAFDSVDQSTLWYYKMNYECYSGEGVAVLHTKNMGTSPILDSFRLPLALYNVLQYIGQCQVVANDGSGSDGLVLSTGKEDKVGRYDYEEGAEMELLSVWLARTLSRLTSNPNSSQEFT